MSEFPITREQFAAWLASKEDAEIVGISATPDCCPIAKGCETNGHPVFVLSRGWRSQNEDRHRFLPRWAERFVQIIDHKGSDKPITAADARRILAEIQ